MRSIYILQKTIFEYLNQTWKNILAICAVLKFRAAYAGYLSLISSKKIMCQEWQPNRRKNKDWWAEFKPKLIESLQNCSHYLPLCCIPKIRIKVESSCGRPSVWMASAFCIQLGACGCSCRAPSRPSRLHLRVLFFSVIVFFLTINLSEAYQSSSPTCLFCHLTTPAEMMLSNTHTHTDVPHTTNSRTQAKKALIFFCSTIKTQNLSKPVCAWCDSLTAVVYQLHITFLGAKLAKNRDCLLSGMKGGTISLFAILSTITTTIIFPMCHFWKEQGALTHPC